jgi:hypothetical protein
MQLLDLSCRAYSLLLPLYPPRLRLEFGEEMADVFAEQLRDECAESGIAGLARVWWRVAVEVLEGALPMTAGWSKIWIPAASVATSLAAFMLFLWASGMARFCVK